MSAQESEEQRLNPFYPAFDLLLAKLLAADQALNLAEGAFGYATDSPGAWLGRVPVRPLAHMLGDICDDRNPGYVKLIPSVRIPDKETELLLRAMRDLRAQSYLWTIARAFEHFREFMETVDAELAGSDSEGADRGSEPSKQGEFDRALRRVRDALPALVTCEMTNARKIQLQQWIRVAAAVRHAVAHNEGILKATDYERYRSSGIEAHFPGELEDDTGCVLKPTPESTAKTIRTFREYGVAIYKAVSDAFGFPATLLGPNGELTTWRR